MAGWRGGSLCRARMVTVAGILLAVFPRPTKPSSPDSRQEPVTDAFSFDNLDGCVRRAGLPADADLGAVHRVTVGRQECEQDESPAARLPAISATTASSKNPATSSR